jgi:CheY-like chemotaxis protein
MGNGSLNRETPQAIRMTFQRLCEDEGRVHLTFGTLKGDFRVLGEAPDRVILAISDLERGQWRLKPGSRLTLTLLDRGLPFEAVVDLQGHGKLQGVEACHVTLPRVLRALETHRLGDFVPDRPLVCSFSDQHNNVKDGHATAFGEDGLELAPPEGTRALGELLRLNATSTVELRIAANESFVLPVRVAYFAEHVWGLRLADGVDRTLLGHYRQWLLEARHRQAQQDLARFNPGGLEFSHHPSPQEAARSATVHPKLLVDRDPLILVLAEGEAFPARLAEAIGRKFGVAALDIGPSALKPALAELGAGAQNWGRVRLVMIHARLRSGTSLDRCRRLAQEEGCPLPILMVGNEEEAELKRNRAAAAGAVDYLVVDPFHVLTVLRTLDDTLKLFS